MAHGGHSRARPSGVLNQTAVAEPHDRHGGDSSSIGGSISTAPTLPLVCRAIDRPARQSARRHVLTKVAEQ